MKPILGLSFVLMGALFTWLLWYSYQRSQSTRDWLAVEATITQSDIRHRRPTPNSTLKYQNQLRYTYQHQGQRHTGKRIRFLDRDRGHLNHAKATQALYALGTTHTAWINPEDPSESILRKETKAGLYSIWFPFLFVVGGLGIMIGRKSRNTAK